MSNRPWLSAYPPGVPADIDRDGLQAGRHNLNNRSFSGYGCDLTIRRS